MEGFGLYRHVVKGGTTFPARCDLRAFELASVTDGLRGHFWHRRVLDYADVSTNFATGFVSDAQHAGDLWN